MVCEMLEFEILNLTVGKESTWVRYSRNSEGREWSCGRMGSEMARCPVPMEKILSMACLIRGSWDWFKSYKYNRAP